MGFSLKSLFFEEQENNQQPQGQPQASQTQTTTYISQLGPGYTAVTAGGGVALVPNQPQVVSTQPNQELLEKLYSFLGDANVPHPNYVELKQAVVNPALRQRIADEATRYFVAFTTLQSANKDLTKEAIIESIDQYIKLLQFEQSNVQAAGAEELTKLESDKKQIEEYRKQIEEIANKMHELQVKVEEKTSKVEANTQEFAEAVEFISTKLLADKDIIARSL